MWYDFYSKKTVKTNIAGFKKSCKKGPDPQILAVKASGTEHWIKELENSDMEILDYCTD